MKQGLHLKKKEKKKEQKKPKAKGLVMRTDFKGLEEQTMYMNKNNKPIITEVIKKMRELRK